MSTENLTAYLREHAAGASAALDLLDHLIASHADSADEHFFTQLRADIEADKTTLDGVLARVGKDESGALNTLTRLGEKFARVKFVFAGPGHGDLGRLEALEMLSLGIEGKRILWLALEAAAVPAPRDMDYPTLLARAAAQRAGVESRRLAAGRAALAPAA